MAIDRALAGAQQAFVSLRPSPRPYGACAGRNRRENKGGVGGAPRQITQTLAARHRDRPSFLADCVGFVGALPGKARAGAAEVAVGRRRTIDRAAQIERFDDALGRELEKRANDFGDLDRKSVV